jgi:BSD domain
MLKAMRSDLNGLFSLVRSSGGGVSEDTTMASSTISGDLKEFYRDMCVDATKTATRVTEETSTMLEILDDRVRSELLLSWTHEDAVNEIEHRRGLMETYTSPLMGEEEEEEEETEEGAEDSESAFEISETVRFLEGFRVDGSTEQIRAALEEHPLTVRARFEALVPAHVSHEQFWARYFFRCDVELLIRAWTISDDRIRGDRSRAIRDLKSTVIRGPVALVPKPIRDVMSWEKIKAGLEAKHRQSLKEVYTTPLLKLDWADQQSKGTVSDDPHTEHEIKETKKFLETFDVGAKTEEITKILDANRDTVKSIFEDLVPVQVSYEDFWERYFFRCDADRIRQAWKLERMNRGSENIEKAPWSISSLGKPVYTITSPVRNVLSKLSMKGDANIHQVPVSDRNDVEVIKQDIKAIEDMRVTSSDKMSQLRGKRESARRCPAEREMWAHDLQHDLDATKNTSGSCSDTSSIDTETSFCQVYELSSSTVSSLDSSLPSKESPILKAMVPSASTSLGDEDLTDIEEQGTALPLPRSSFANLNSPVGSAFHVDESKKHD